MGSRARTKKRRLGFVLQTAAMGAVALTTRASLADHYRVPSGSMEPTVQTGDHVIVNKAAYGVRLPLTRTWLVRYATPARGEVVIVDGDEPPVLLKRVVAVEGDVVEVRAGRVSIGGVPVPEPNVNVDRGGGPDFGPVEVPPGKLFVLGDNRGNSRDGRMFGWVDRRRVLGRAMAVVSRDGGAAYEPL